MTPVEELLEAVERLVRACRAEHPIEILRRAYDVKNVWEKHPRRELSGDTAKH